MTPLRFLLSSTAALALALAGHGRAAEASPAEGTLKNGVRTVEMAVTENGFEPSRVKVNKGEKVRLVVTRKTDSTCATEIVIADQGVNAELPLGKAVAVEFTPTKAGEIRYVCGMGHVGGVLFVK
ncbi:MAG TPA: cupredoxin domain-containing protein [Anaeromyxobacter sp.]